ncbi:Lrp/AsnC family transcriptional regulator [Ornithinicoccus hortensis]|uniref:AsnC family transcriptional regulator n=1 Tax=Ornithinicoccus hortensis TaxID=82346 RepID=A0A542YSZ2_9MICO|nr:Lrp/AsnC family transcriptional regulator [Ornithinicoccus hortensis]TQL51213.1 AsnC family transcriptional regulator [Ornithinicoccus hortensis]
MEALDRHIVSLLAEDGRMSYADLGRRTGLSTSAVHQRVKRLEERGVITGYRAVVDFEQVGLPLTALIALSPFDPASPDDIPQRLEHLPQIDSCWSVAGRENYVIQVRLAKPSDLEQLLADIRSAANCASSTTVVLSTPWEGRPVDLPESG